MISRPALSRLLLFQSLALWIPLGLTACSSNNNNGGPTDGGDGGYLSDGGLPNAGGTLDSTSMAQTPIAMAVGPNDRVGVAYFRDFPVGGGTNYQVRYVEWQNGQASQSELVQTVALQYGITIAFQSNGQPAIAYLGGTDDGTMSAYWVNSDAAISYRQGPGSWTEYIAQHMSNESLCGNPVDDNASNFVVGIDPALVFIGSTAYLTFRDVHTGQFPVQDWQDSDIKAAIGGPSTWTHVAVACGGNGGKNAYGGHNYAVVANGQPAQVSDQIFDSANGTGQNVLFHKRNSDGSWSASIPQAVATISNTQQGPSLAYEGTLGFALAVVDRGSNALYFLSSTSGTGQWTVPDPVFQSGTGGWYPSVAVDPSIHQPIISYYYCSRQTGVPEGSCPPAENQLRLASRFNGNWFHSVLDTRGGTFTKAAFLSNGRRVVAYRDPASGALRLFADP